QVRPGELSRAHGGVLFLDEFPLFRADVIDALRQPMESGDVTVARQGESALLPARGMVVLACNPCPCGDWREHAGSNKCRCREVVRRDYQRKISGPITDRVDITRHVEPLSPHAEHDRFDQAESSASVGGRVELARRLQAIRYTDCSWRLNAHAPGPALRDRWPLSPEGQRSVDDAMHKGRLTRRGAVRVHRVAWTVADLVSVRTGVNHRPGADEVDVALRLRWGAALLARTVQQAAG
ncbi:MAG TPA: ATP-binding protein, partial [Nocardioides sp.]|nr:ATP-binding protein [Nocardioides sp.]